MDQPIAVTIAEACALSRCGRTTIYAALKRQDLSARKLGRKTLILESELRRWIEQLPQKNP